MAGINKIGTQVEEELWRQNQAGVSNAPPVIQDLAAVAEATGKGIGKTAVDINQGAKSVGAKALTTLGVGGAAATDVGTRVVNYFTGAEPKNLLPGNIQAFKTAWGIGNVNRARPPVNSIQTPKGVNVKTPAPSTTGNNVMKNPDIAKAFAEINDEISRSTLMGEGEPSSPFYNKSIDEKGTLVLNPKSPEEAPDQRKQELLDEYNHLSKMASKGYLGKGSDKFIRLGAVRKQLKDLNELEKVDLAGRYGVMGHQISADVESQKHSLEVRKFMKENDMKDPVNLIKLAAIVGGKKKVKTTDEQTGEETIAEDVDLESGIKSLAKLGLFGKDFNLPKDTGKRKPLAELLTR